MPLRWLHPLSSRIYHAAVDMCMLNTQQHPQSPYHPEEIVSPDKICTKTPSSQAHSPHYTTPTPRIPKIRKFPILPLKSERDFCIRTPIFRWTPLPEAIPSRRNFPVPSHFLRPPHHFRRVPTTARPSQSFYIPHLACRHTKPQPVGHSTIYTQLQM